jgi:hypothetical protein
VAGLAAAAITAGALVAGTVIGLGRAHEHHAAQHPLPPGGGAAQLLARIADAAARQPAAAVADSQYVYIRSQVAFTATSVYLGAGGKQIVKTQMQRPHQRQIWYSVSNLCRKGLLRENGRDTVLTSGGRCPDHGSLNDPTYRFLQRLPASPRALLRMIYRVEKGHGPSPDAEAFTTIGDLLRESIAPPAVSAALYRAAALIPGVTALPRATDAAGRHGVAVSFTDQGLRQEWIFARSSLRMIGERDVAVKSGATTGVSAILVRAFVDHPGQIPAASSATPPG